MKTPFKLILSMAAISCLFACSKNNVPPASTVAALNFVNATVGTSPVVVRIGNPNTIYSNVAQSNLLGYGTSNVFSPVAGNTAFAVVQTSDTTHTLFSGNLNLQNYNVYSLYLTGTVVQPDTVFIHENPPHYANTDSVAGIRFVNLSPGSNPVSVDIMGQANGSEVSSLSYKAYTAFKRYKADHTIASYIFEFRDAASGTLLATYELDGVNTSDPTGSSYNTVQFRNMTIALIGQPSGGTVAQSTLLIPNY